MAVARNFDPQSAKLVFEHLLALAVTGVASRVGNRLVASAISATETDAGCRRWERDAEYTLCGNIRVDDAYLDGELAGGKAGRDSQSEVPFVAAISLGTKAVPCMIKMALIFGFTRKTVFDWTTADLASGCIVTSDGLSCFAGITDAGCQHRAIVADGLKNFSSQKK